MEPTLMAKYLCTLTYDCETYTAETDSDLAAQFEAGDLTLEEVFDALGYDYPSDIEYEFCQGVSCKSL